MALFVDGPACTIDDLTDQDTGLLDVVLTNNINVSTKLRLAVEEIRTDLHLWLNRPRPTLELVWGPTLHIEQIVITPPLKRWEIMHALALVYRDAYFSQLVDRYQAKWHEYAKLARHASESFTAGEPAWRLVSDPVVQAAPPILSATPAPQTGGTFYASVTWVNSTKSGRRAVFRVLDHGGGWKFDDGRGYRCAGERSWFQGVCRHHAHHDVPAE